MQDNSLLKLPYIFLIISRWLVVLRINVDLAIFKLYLDLEAGDYQSLKIQVARPGIEPRSSCSAIHSATAAPYMYVEHSFETYVSDWYGHVSKEKKCSAKNFEGILAAWFSHRYVLKRSFLNSITLICDPDSRCRSMGPSGNTNGWQRLPRRLWNPRHFTKSREMNEKLVFILIAAG